MCNGLRTCRNANVFVFEQGYEREGQHQRVACEDEPHGLPVGNAVLSVILHHFTAHNAAQDTAEAIGHHQEHPLRAGADFRAYFFFDKHRARNVEEVEGAAVHNHRQYQQNGTERRRVAISEQAETQHPRHNTDKHNVLNTITAQEERNGQDE